VSLGDGEEGVLGRNINKSKKKKMSGNSKLFDFAQHLYETHGSDIAPLTVTFEPTRYIENFSSYVTFSFRCYVL